MYSVDKSLKATKTRFGLLKVSLGLVQQQVNELRVGTVLVQYVYGRLHSACATSLIDIFFSLCVLLT